MRVLRLRISLVLNKFGVCEASNRCPVLPRCSAGMSGQIALFFLARRPKQFMGLQGGWEIKAGKPLPKESFGAQKLEKCCCFGTAVIMCQHASVFCGSALAVALVVQSHQLEVAVPVFNIQHHTLVSSAVCSCNWVGCCNLLTLHAGAPVAGCFGMLDDSIVKRQLTVSVFSPMGAPFETFLGLWVDLGIAVTAVPYNRTLRKQMLIWQLLK